MAEFIPVGRTSLVRKGGIDLQVQTEYANRPYPRLTTSVLSSGRVIHKIEKKLTEPVSTVEAQSLMEQAIQRQHQEVLLIVGESFGRVGTGAVTRHSEAAQPSEPVAIAEPEPEPLVELARMDELMTDDPATLELTTKQTTPLTSTDRMIGVEGVREVYRLDIDGNFDGTEREERFRRRHGSIARSLPELINVFLRSSGAVPVRERGVYEIEQDKLYLVSLGSELLILEVVRMDHETDFERAFSSALLY